MTQPAGQGGEPTEPARAAGEVGVPRSSDDPPESKTGGERRRGTWVKVRGHSEGRDDGRTEAEALFDRITTPAKVQKLQRVLYRKAKAEPGYRFYSLYGELLRRDIIETAMSAVANNAGAAGVDGQECSIYTRSDEAWTQWRDTLLEGLRTKTYRPSPVRRVRIPKGDGKTRPLGIPTVKDRVVQTAVALLLLPIWEADSHPQSYAYRPKRSAQQAMDAISTALRSGRTEVIDCRLERLLRQHTAPGVAAVGRASRQRRAHPCPHQGMAACPDSGTRPGHGPPHDYGQPSRHAARRRHQSAAGQPVFEPVGLAGERTLRTASGAGALRGRLRYPVPTGTGGGVTGAAETVAGRARPHAE